MAFPSQNLQQVQKQSQQLVLAPQLRHSLKILQVPALDLRATIQEELQSNPLLEELPMETPNIETGSAETDTDNTADSNGELDSHHDQPEQNSDNDHDQIERDLEILNQLDDDWRDLHAQTRGSTDYSSDAIKRRQHFFDSLVSETSLQEHLMSQASLTDCTPEQRTALDYLIGNLDNRGFLASSIDEIRLFSQLPHETFLEAWKILKTFDPPGIGASDIQDCLLEQLKQNGKENSIAAKIIRDHFDALLRRRIPEIARRLGQSIDEIENAIAEIAALDPAPGRRFGEDNNRTISPDVTVEKIGDEWIVTLNNEYIPRLRISNTYKDMIASGRLSRKEKEYIHEKMKSGRFLISSIELRQQTIEKITRELLRVQRDFFEEGLSQLRPLTMTQVAERVGVHETTVSRAIANKYIQTPHGIFEFKFFFTPGYQSGDGQSLSNQTVKEMIAQLIENEDPRKPFSDQQIRNLLAEKNIDIARRTVAKYRESLGILATNLRRHYS